MPDPLAFDQQRLNRLMQDLETLRKRPLDNTLDLTGITELREIVACLQSDLWRTGERAAAIKATLRTAIGVLPTRRLPCTPANSTLTWQQAALIMYQVEPLPHNVLDGIANEYSNPQLYARLARYVRDLAGFPDNVTEFKDKVATPMKKHIANSLLVDEAKKITEEAQQADDNTSEATQSREGQHKSAPDASSHRGGNIYAYQSIVGDYGTLNNNSGTR